MNIELFAKNALGVPFLDNGKGFSGWDCWGLVVKAYEDCAGITVPAFNYISALNSKEIKVIYDNTKEKWVEVPIGQEKPMDVVVLRYKSSPCHTGVVVKKGLMLHVDARINTCVESYCTGLWKTRVVGIFRHKEMGGRK